ncbi:glutaminase [Demequina iriomotensis]|uniref:glutaminase n=1 Tax=Demequina iriomotensis TaxID=1536641 RepID=UPI000A8F5071|nr:glutaminase [Demequina iriomotensis]
MRTVLAAAVDDARLGPAGRVTEVYPALAAVDPVLLAAAVHPLTGEAAVAGHVGARFILMSVAKPFTLALAVDAHGADSVLALTGLEATGLPFNDPAAITGRPGGRTNPMVNPGAITVASLLTEPMIRDGLSRFAGRELGADAVMVSAIQATNERNRLLASLLAERGLLGAGLEEALRLYTLQSCVGVSIADLARMGAVLAHGGVDPVDGGRVVSAEAARLAVDAMALAGLYEASGAWAAGGGLPAKSGIAGGLVMVAPGIGALAAYSPGLDGLGNPLRAQAVATAMAPWLAEGPA